MIIAVNTNMLREDYHGTNGRFVSETLGLITEQHPEHQFIFVSGNAYNREWMRRSNITTVIAAPGRNNPLFLKWWYDYRLAAILKKYKADVYFAADGVCSLRTKIPQCLLVNHISFKHYPHGIPASRLFFLRKYTHRWLQKAKQVITLSEFSKKDIIDNYPGAGDKIKTMHSGVSDIFRPVSDSQRTDTIEKYSDGIEYFLYVGSVQQRKNLINLLKAFSIFKKRQRSGLKLLLAGRSDDKKFTATLSSYKYRDDVILTGYLDDQVLSKLMASAWALVYPSLWEGSGLTVAEAMRSKIPVIVSQNSALSEIAGDAALYADPHDPSSIAEQMMLIYKDERLRTELIEKGYQRSQEFDWGKTAKQLWAILNDCINPES
jgi:glycosyltransferase involved in cell wall biosynthesis